MISVNTLILKSYKLLQPIVIMISLIGCATTNTVDSNHYAGKTYTGSIKLQELYIPLPEGEWCVIGSGDIATKVINGKINTATDDRFQLILLNKSQNGQVNGLISITRDKIGNKLNGYMPRKEFDRTDVYNVVVIDNSLRGAHDCWLLNYSIMAEWHNKNQVQENAFNYLISNKIIIPKVMIYSSHHFTGKNNKNKLLDYYYYTNPEIAGFSSSVDSNKWSTNDWNLSQISKDNNKVEYIDKMKMNAESMHERLRVAFGD